MLRPHLNKEHCSEIHNLRNTASDIEDGNYCTISLLLRSFLSIHHSSCAILLNVNIIRSAVCEELHDYSLKTRDSFIISRACERECHVTHSALMQMQLCFRPMSTKKSEHLSIIYQMESFRGKHSLCPASLPSAPINQHHCH